MTKTLLAAALSIALAPAAWAQDAAPTSSTPNATELDAVSVIGSGEARQVQRITRENLDILPPGTSLQKTLNLLPGVNAQSADALGTNEQSMTLSLRGFNSTRLGYTLDGVPLGDGAYNNYNGLTINRALISENMAGAELAVGIGSLGTPSTSNLGGTISYTSDRPAQELGGRVVQTFGSDANRRTFVRVDSGEYNGFSGYVSGMNAVSDLWNDQTAYNKSTTKQFNAKGVWNFGRGQITGFVDTSRTTQADYFYLSKDEMSRGLGWDWGGYAPDWNRAVAKAYCNTASFNAKKCDSSGPDKDADGAFTAGSCATTTCTTWPATSSWPMASACAPWPTTTMTAAKATTGTAAPGRTKAPHRRFRSSSATPSTLSTAMAARCRSTGSWVHIASKAASGTSAIPAAPSATRPPLTARVT